MAVGYASNAVGTINPVEEIVRLAHAAGALAFIDAVHYAPHGPIDVRSLDCDFLACSPYKFFGPHMGCIYGKREHLLRLSPYKVRPAPDDLPDRWETGTQIHEGLAGVAAAIDYLADSRPPLRSGGNQPSSALLAAYRAIRQHEMSLAAHMIGGLLEIPGLRFYGITDPARFAERVPTVSVRLKIIRRSKPPPTSATAASSPGTATTTPSISPSVSASNNPAASSASASSTTTPPKKSIASSPLFTNWHGAVKEESWP